MKFSLFIDNEREEEVIIYAREKNALTERIESIVNESERDVFGYRNEEIVKLELTAIACVFVEADKVYTIADGERYQLRERLYQMEALLGNSCVRINQSCIVRVSEIERFDTSLSGALKVNLKNGFKDYVSRRQMKRVKERLGL